MADRVCDALTVQWRRFRRAVQRFRLNSDPRPVWREAGELFALMGDRETADHWRAAAREERDHV